jgi:indole-3-pyruvate monooxygenase
MDERFDALVIGAGFCGLGVGASLREKGIERFAILEQGDQVGHFWTKTYERLHLHSAFHDLPKDGGLRRDYPIFLSRDELLDYFARYAELHGLAPHLRFGTRVERVQRIEPDASDGDEWRLETSRGVFRARCLAVATAMNRVPKWPDIPGRERFRGRALHSAEYRNPRAFAGHSVLVVGSGNSAAEISLDLVEGGARAVAMWVRAPRHFIPIRRMEILFRVFRALGALSEKQASKTHRVSWGTPEFDRIIAARDKISCLLSVDLSRFGICKPARGPMAELAETGRIPTFDQGAIPKIRSGAIRVIDGNRRPIECFTEDGMRFGDGAEAFDDVVLATGFEPGLEQFLDVPGLLGPVLWWKRYPLTDGRSRSRVHPSVFFPGFDRTPLGGHSLGRWGWEVGERIAEDLGRAAPRGY